MALTRRLAGRRGLGNSPFGLKWRFVDGASRVVISVSPSGVQHPGSWALTGLASTDDYQLPLQFQRTVGR